ncbi:MAG TPA: response regulator, partial [Chloroflexota bacterium]
MDARPITALLIEDDVAWTTLIKVVLTQSKEVQFAVTCASCLEEGLRRCSEQSFDVVLLDLNLPDSRGPETLTRLYQHVPTVPILALTSRRDERVALEAMKAGAQDYLPKSSLNTDLLVRTIRYAIERKRAAEALRASEERFRLLAENAQDMIFRYEMVPRRGFSYVNPAATHLTGYAREEFYADPDLPFQYVHPDHHAELRRMLQGEAIKPST